MTEENVSQIVEKCCLDDAKPMEISVETMHVKDEEIQGDDVLPPAAEINHVKVKPNPKRVIDKQASKPQAEPRYRGNQTSSTHDLCKHGKRREEDLVIKPWKLVKKKNGDLEKTQKSETLRKSLGNVAKPEKSSLDVAKKEGADEIVKSCDDLGVKRIETKSTNPNGSAVVRMVKKTNPNVKKVSRISENRSSKEDLLKNLKNKEKMKINEPVRCDDVVLEKTNFDVKKGSRVSESKSSKEDLLKNKEKTKIDEPFKCDDVVLEKTLYVVESSEEKVKRKSIKSVNSEIQQSSERKILRGSRKQSLIPLPSFSPSSEEVKESRVTRSDPRPIKQTTSKSKTSLSEKKEIGSANLVTMLKTESKIKPKRIALKVTPPAPPTKQLMSFNKGKVIESKPEGTAPTLIKFRKRVVQEPKLKSDVNKRKKNLKDKREGGVKINGEGKREKVVLRHRKVEVKKKLQTLFNNVIEETVNKLEEVRKSKVKALVGAFETVISLQDNDKTSQKKNFRRKPTSSQVVEGKV